MRSRLVRLALVAVGVLGMTGMPVEPAAAHTVGSAAFVAEIEVTGGIGYPLLPDSLPTEPPDVPPRQHCLPLPSNSLLGIVEDTTEEITEEESWNCHWVFEHRRSVNIESIVCNGAAANVGKTELPETSGTTCTFAGSGFVTGHCGLSGGQVTVEFNDGHNDYILDLHFRGIGSLLVISGHWTNDLGQHGKVYAQAQALPPDPVNTPGGQSCTNKTATDFLVTGTAELYSDPMLL